MTNKGNTRKYAFYDKEMEGGYFQTVFENLGDPREAGLYNKYKKTPEYEKYFGKLPKKINKLGLAKRLQVSDN